MVVIFVWLFVVLLLSIIPTKGLQAGHTDKVIHFVIYGITAIMFLRILLFKMSLSKAVFLSIILASLFGFVIELIQYAIPWRECSFSDVVANVSGAVLFSLIYIVNEFYRKKI